MHYLLKLNRRGPNMKKWQVFAGIFLVFAVVLWVNRVPLIIRLPGIISDIRNPIGPNQDIYWEQGPETAELSAMERKPNIIVIMADDLGFNDVSLNGGGAAGGVLKTPSIDALAREGVTLANGYAGSAVCSISRAMMMTGRYSTRFGFEFTPTPDGMGPAMQLVIGEDKRLHPMIFSDASEVSQMPFADRGLPMDEITIAQLLQQSGYHTVHIGKWHLGSAPAMLPHHRGFDESLLMRSGKYLPDDDPNVVNSKQDFDPIDQFLWPNMRFAASFNDSDQFQPRGYLTDYYTDEAIRVIEANKNRPFFLFLAHWGVHTPLQALKSDYDSLPQIENHRLRVYAAMIKAVDRSVGRVMAALKDNGLDDNTLVIFTSDNGGANYIGLPDINKPYRGWKLTFYEGGTHVPFAMRWPSRIGPGTVLDSPVSHLDIFATTAAAAGAELPDDRIMDTVDLMPYILGETEGAPRETIFWREGFYRAVLTEGWKLQVSDNPAKKWLYNMTVDPTEQTNLAEVEPELVKRLTGLLDAHNAEQVPPMWPSGVQMPIMLDKTLEAEQAPEDEYIYWPN